MPLAQTLHRTARGLFSQFNRIHGIPEGGLLEATNVEINRTGVISKSRGRRRFGIAAADRIEQILEFKDRLIRHSQVTLEYDADGAGQWIPLNGAFVRPDAANKMRSAEALKSLFFTTQTGVFKKQVIQDDPVRSGIHEALDLYLTKTGIGGGILLVDSQTAYRVIFGRRDVNKKLLLGAPSWREVITNTKATALAWTRLITVVTVTHVGHGFSNGNIIEVSDSSDTAAVPNGPKVISNITANTYDFTGINGGAAAGTLSDGKKFNVDLNFTIPTDIVSTDFYQVFRTQPSGSATSSPGDDMRLVQEIEITPTDIINGVINFTDTVDSAFLGEPLYTNENQEGLTSANDRPPFARDIVLFKGHLWFIGTKEPHAKEITLLTVQGFVDNTDFIRILFEGKDINYIFSGGEDIPNHKFQRFTGEATQAQNVERTAKSLCKVINRDPTQTSLEARYISEEDDNPGIIEFRIRTLNTGSIIFRSNANAGPKFRPALPTTGSNVASDDADIINLVRRSKFERAEAVPIGNSDAVGSESRKVLRGLALKDSLILLTEDGIFRVSGESDGFNGDSFIISQLDPSIKVVVPDAAVVLNNSVYCLSTQGVIRVDESGTDLISNAIEDELKKLFAISDYADRVFAVAYESDRKYILYRLDADTQDNPQRAHVYNYLTDAWTERRKSISAAHVLFGSDLLYEGHGDDLFVLEERKSFSDTNDDFLDEDIPITVTAFTTTVNAKGQTVSLVTVTYNYPAFPVQSGLLFTQGTAVALVNDFTVISSTSYQLELDSTIIVAAGAATLSLAINSRVRWRPESVQNPNTLKQFPEIGIYLEENRAFKHRVGFFSDVDAGEFFVRDIEIMAGSGWGEGEWGDFPWGDEGTLAVTPLRVIVPRNFQRCRTLSLIYEHNRAKERFDILSVAYVYVQYTHETVRSPR